MHRYRPIILLFLFFSTITSSRAADGEVTLREIRVYGNHNTSRVLILHNCEFEEGKAYAQEELDRRIELTRQNLVNTYYFDRVNVFDLPRSVPDEAVILIDVYECSPWHATGTTWSARLYRDNVGGHGLTLGLQAGDTESQVFFEQPWVLDSRLFISHITYFKGGVRTLIEKDVDFGGEWFRDEVFGLENTISYLFPGRTELGLRGTWERHDFYDQNFKAAPEKRFGVGDNLDLVFVKPFLLIDRRDNDRYPNKGFYFNPEGQISHDLLGAYTFNKACLDSRFYVNPAKLLVIALRICGGWCSDETPYYELFDISGLENVRSEGNNNTVGNIMGTANLELRRYLFRSPVFDGWFEGVAFADVGWTWDANEPVTFETPAYAFGPGIRLHIQRPIYMDCRLEYGIGKENMLVATVSPIF